MKVRRSSVISVVAGPDAALGRAAEAALVVGVGGDALRWPSRARRGGRRWRSRPCRARRRSPPRARPFGTSQCVRPSRAPSKLTKSSRLQPRPGEARRRASAGCCTTGAQAASAGAATARTTSASHAAEHLGRRARADKARPRPRTRGCASARRCCARRGAAAAATSGRKSRQAAHGLGHRAPGPARPAPRPGPWRPTSRVSSTLGSSASSRARHSAAQRGGGG